ncbi:MAG: efflux transporter outer membrane subunit [Acidobacteriota bacterium]|nr:efflux transporter outer membrane subunit [Acidobacteriota bacterium]
MGRHRTAPAWGLLLAAAWTAGCAVGPRYVAPAVTPPAAYKETPPADAGKDWAAARPADAVARGAWWTVYGDPALNGLEAQIEAGNETLKAAQARFLQARALVRSARAAYLPQVGAAAGVTPGAQSGNKPLRSPLAPRTYTDYLVSGDVSWEPDLWQRIGRTVEASRAAAQASAADAESVRLALHAECAVDYFVLRGLDAQKQLLDDSVAAYEKTLELTQARHAGGLASGADVAQAETQLETTRAQDIDTDVQRAQVEHAIAVLVGQPASTFSIARRPLTTPPPSIPPGVPSQLLERRPDIAAAERRVAAANAEVGLAQAAYYPLVLLNGAGGFEAGSIGDWFRGLSAFWSLGPAAAMTVFDGGRRRAVSEQARAAYDQAVAGYRQTVLEAFEEVEDSLVALRVLGVEAKTTDAAVAAAQRSLALAMSRYRGGVASYLEVTAAQTAALSDQRTAVGILTRRMTASVLLIQALGGGWNASTLPSGNPGP